MTVSPGSLGYSNRFNILVLGSVSLLFNNHLQTAFYWPYCFVDCLYRETFYSFCNTVTELQFVPPFNLFLQNLLFKLLMNDESSGICSLLGSNQVICGQYREQTPENISHSRDSQASFATTMFDVHPHFARRNGYQKKYYIIQNALMSTWKIQVNMVQLFSLLDLSGVNNISFCNLSKVLHRVPSSPEGNFLGWTLLF